MDSQRIRETFLRFFQERDHRVMPSAPLVPRRPNAALHQRRHGAVQALLRGRATPPARRLTSVQKCFRTSDIDSVGDTSHLTFFEMLGNFSVGDYFKAEAIPWAWELVTSKDWFAMAPIASGPQSTWTTMRRSTLAAGGRARRAYHALRRGAQLLVLRRGRPLRALQRAALRLGPYARLPRVRSAAPVTRRSSAAASWRSGTWCL